ncbi:MAG: transketolase, partial [Deltaproteobacteria bacterium]|nr:transketolase [Deltaproteobacteria bacterium]
NRKGPVALALTRQGLPTLDREAFAHADGLHGGAYVLKDARDGRANIMLIASGSEVPVAIEAARRLEEKGLSIRVVSMPSWELFEKQPREYRHEVLPPDIKARVAVEAGVTQGWHRYVGEAGRVVGINHFGASAPSGTLFEKFELTAEKVVEAALSCL